MFNSQDHGKLWLAVAAAAVLSVAGCSNQPASEDKNQPANEVRGTPKKSETAKPASAPAKVAEPPQLITVPKGTAISATVGQTLASSKNHAGDSFAASLATPIEVDGKIVIPKGAHVTGRIVTVKKSELKVTLSSVRVHGKSYDLETNSIRPSDKSQAQNKAKDSAKSKDKKDMTVPAKTQLTFKLAKPVIVPVKG